MLKLFKVIITKIKSNNYFFTKLIFKIINFNKFIINISNLYINRIN